MFWSIIAYYSTRQPLQNFLLHQWDEFSITLFRHFCQRHESQRRAIHTVAQAALVHRPVIKHMTKVAVTDAASHFHPFHEQFLIRTDCYRLRRYRSGITGPAGAGIKFVARTEQRFACNHINIDSRLMIVPIFIVVYDTS